MQVHRRGPAELPTLALLAIVQLSSNAVKRRLRLVNRAFNLLVRSTYSWLQVDERWKDQASSIQGRCSEITKWRVLKSASCNAVEEFLSTSPFARLAGLQLQIVSREILRQVVALDSSRLRQVIMYLQDFAHAEIALPWLRSLPCSTHLHVSGDREQTFASLQLLLTNASQLHGLTSMQIQLPPQSPRTLLLELGQFSSLRQLSLHRAPTNFLHDVCSTCETLLQLTALKLGLRCDDIDEYDASPLSKLSRLENFTLYDCDNHYGDVFWYLADLESTLNQLSELRHLAIKADLLLGEPLSINLPHLTALKFLEGGETGGFSLDFEALTNSPNLQHLVMPMAEVLESLPTSLCQLSYFAGDLSPAAHASLGALSNLQELHLEHSNELMEYPIMHAFACLPLLRVLRIGRVGLKADDPALPLFPCLEEMECRLLTGMGDDALWSLCNALSSTPSIGFMLFDDVASAEGVGAAIMLLHVEAVSLSGRYCGHDQLMAVLHALAVSNSRRLLHLTLSHLPALSSKHITVALASFPILDKLQVTYCGKISAQHARILADEHLPGLEVWGKP